MLSNVCWVAFWASWVQGVLQPPWPVLVPPTLEPLADVNALALPHEWSRHEARESSRKWAYPLSIQQKYLTSCRFVADSSQITWTRLIGWSARVSTSSGASNVRVLLVPPLQLFLVICIFKRPLWQHFKWVSGIRRSLHWRTKTASSGLSDESAAPVRSISTLWVERFCPE